MTKLRRLASSVALTLGFLCAPAAAHAQDVPPAAPQFPGTPLSPAAPQFPGTPLPLGSAPAPAPLQLYPPGYWTPYGAALPVPPAKSWYGWQILIPTLASDAVTLTSLFAGGGSSAALGFAVAGALGHGLSGPIVHLAHGHPLKALASFGLEAALPLLVAAAGAAVSSNNSTSDEDGPSVGLLVILLAAPIALTAGPAIDSAALAWEDRPPSDKAAGVTFNVAPLVLPPLRAGAAHAPAPVGVALVGTF
jgi:hypothetical protein